MTDLSSNEHVGDLKTAIETLNLARRGSIDPHGTSCQLSAGEATALWDYIDDLKVRLSMPPAPETNDDLPLARNALGNLYMAVLKFGPIDRDIQFAMREAAKLLGPPYLSEKTECDRGIHERGATDICVRCGTMLMPSDTRGDES